MSKPRSATVVHTGEQNIQLRHSRACSIRENAECTCTPSYQVKVYDGMTGARRVRSFRSLAAAQQWRDMVKESRADRRERLRTVCEVAFAKTSDDVWGALVDSWAARS